MFRKTISIMLSLTMAVTMVLSAPVISMASSAYTEDTSSVREVFHGFHIDAEEASFNDDLFTTDAREYNTQLAALTFALGTSSSNCRRIKDPSQYYTLMSKNVYEFLEDNGFSDIYVNYDYSHKPTDNSAAAIFAHKKIRDEGKDYTLLVLEPKGSTLEAEYNPVMNVSTKTGDRGDYAAFAALRDKTLESARQYIRDYDIKGDIKVWTAGYSRSGGIANLIAASLIDDPNGYLGSSVKLTPDNVYCYSMGSIMTAENSKDLHAARYDSIHHIISTDDGILKSPTEKISFGLYGQVHYITDLADKAEAIRQMDIRYHPAYEEYFSKGKDPDGFSPKKLDIGSLLKGEFVLEDDDDSYLPYDQSEYLESVFNYLTAVVSEGGSTGIGRDAYYENYQEPLGRLVKFITDEMDGGGFDASVITGNKMTVPFVLSLYITFIADKSVRDGRTGSAEFNAAVENTFNTIASLIEDNEGHIKSEYDRSRRADPIYILFRNRYFVENENSGEMSADGTIQKYRLRKTVKADRKFLEAMRTLTAGLYSALMRDVLSAEGVDEDIIKDMTGREDSRAVTYFLMHLLFGNDRQSKAVRPISPENEQFRHLATFIGNFNRYTTRHMATQTMPWLRAGDRHFDDAQPLTKAQTSGYRRVYLSPVPGIDISGIVKNENGETVASFRNGRITSRTEDWIGITAYDSGYWLRLPLDAVYTVEFKVSGDTELDLELAEYSVNIGKVLRKDSWPDLQAYKNGSVILKVPAVGADGSGYDLPSAVKYSVSTDGSASGDENAGPAGKTKYSKSVPKAKNVRVKAGSGSLTVRWKKLSTGQRRKFSRTEVQYSTSKKFRTYKTLYVSKKRTSVKIKDLKKGRTYYVRVRNVRNKDGIRYVSRWSVKEKARAGKR